VTLRAVRINGIVRVSFEGGDSILAKEVPAIHDAGIACLKREGDVIVDLRGLGFVDSAGLGLLIGLLRRARGQGRRLVFAGAAPPLRRILQSIRLDRILELFPDTREAEVALCDRQTA
jgi:anti-sigma B factor antagonist